MTVEIAVTAHQNLSGSGIDRLRDLFDDEYLHDFGDWDPDAPYGYSPADFHVTASCAGRLVGHVGFQVRTIGVGDLDVSVAGTGGVLVSEDARGSGLGRQLMQRAQQVMRDDAAVSFGYLGCRLEIVSFYESVDWTRIYARERHTARLDPSEIIESASSPILISSATQSVHEWPEGDVDLRGGAW